MKADEVMIDVPSNKDKDDEDIVPLGDDNAILEHGAQESSDKKEDEGNSKRQSILLVGLWLDVVSIREEEGEELARMRGQATPWRAR